jgi:hypothetical protein
MIIFAASGHVIFPCKFFILDKKYILPFNLYFLKEMEKLSCNHYQDWSSTALVVQGYNINWKNSMVKLRKGQTYVENTHVFLLVNSN